MRTMIRLINRRPAERGAVAMLVALLFGSSVLLGSGALVVDVGQLYAEREELQSGADSAAIAVAKSCAVNLSTCNPTQLAETYADGNAKDGHAAVSVICGRGWNLSDCPPTPTSLAGCIGEPPVSGDYVEVRTHTERADGSHLLPPSFSRAFAGNEGFQGTKVAACARANVTPGGPAQEMVTPAVTIEVCYHNEYTNNGTTYSTVERPLYLKDGKGDDPCHGTSSNGANGPGNFGWLDHDGDCEATFNLDGAGFDGNPGNNTDAECVELFDRYINSASPMPLPLFDSVTGNGNNLEYHLSGFAGFMVTGYKFSGNSRPSRITGQELCAGSERCLYGYFVRASFPVVRDGTGTDYGVVGVGGVNVIG